MKKLTHWMIGFAIVGLLLSAYAFLHNRGFVSGSICTVNATINCDVVNKGPFSEFFGVPVALIGFIGYVFLLIGSILKQKAVEDRTLTLFLFGIACGGFGFTLYLTSIEATVLHAWCLICISSQLMMLGFIVAITKLADNENHFSFLKKFFRLRA
ncbi:MAG: vitamin K epoxide reductase family protein [Candidatus Uhrbacteria bacterium]|nr:vitamin K epoxide reductase family protein [Candidatus Uhrbacteria bacterium]